MKPTPLFRSLSLLSLGLLLFSSLSSKDSADLAPLRRKCEAIIKDFPGVVGIGVKDLISGKWFVLITYTRARIEECENVIAQIAKAVAEYR